MPFIPRLLPLSLGLIFLSTTLKVSAQTPNFSGGWQINKSKTNFGQAPEYVLPRALNVTQDAKQLSVDRTNLTSTGEEKHYSQQFTRDGKPSQTITVSGNMETDSLVTASTDQGLTLGMNYKSPANQPVTVASENWTLEDSGNTLVIDRKVTNPDGKGYEIKGFYDKKSS